MNSKQQEMIDSLKWEENNHECYWNKEESIPGVTLGWCHYYGGSASGNNPYDVIQRSDGMIAFPPSNSNNPFSCSQWMRQLKRGFSWVDDRVLVCDEIVTTDHNGR